VEVSFPEMNYPASKFPSIMIESLNSTMSYIESSLSLSHLFVILYKPMG